MLDAPVSGNVIHVEEGTISMIVGGNQAIFEKVKSILQDITTKVSYVGGNGQALLMKIAINLSLPVQFLGFCEGILLAEKNGIPRQISRHSVSRSIGPTWQKNWMLRVPEGSCHEQSSRQVMYPFNTSRDVWSVTGDPGSEHVGQGKGNYMPQTSTKKRFWTDNSFNQFSASCWLVPVFS